MTDGKDEDWPAVGALLVTSGPVTVELFGVTLPASLTVERSPLTKWTLDVEGHPGEHDVRLPWAGPVPLVVSCGGRSYGGDGLIVDAFAPSSSAGPSCTVVSTGPMRLLPRGGPTTPL